MNRVDIEYGTIVSKEGVVFSSSICVLFLIREQEVIVFTSCLYVCRWIIRKPSLLRLIIESGIARRKIQGEDEKDLIMFE